MSDDEASIQQEVRDKYGRAALRVVQGGSSSGCCSGGEGDPVTRDLYQPRETSTLPPEAQRLRERLRSAWALAT